MKKGFTLVEIMMVVGIITLLATIAIPGLLRARVSANEASAQATLQAIATALETYATSNGQYPAAFSSLLSPAANPPYLNKNYINCTSAAPCAGYAFYVGSLTAGGYNMTARPVSCTNTGTKSFSVITGSVLSADATCTPAS